MSEVKQKRIKKLSVYEETLIWMSYRYAIGRHTIASCTHAGDIAQNSYERLLLNPSRMQFMSKDINEEIERCLSFGPCSFRIDRYSGANIEDISPLNIFYQFINSLNIESYNELKKIDNVEAYYDKESSEFKFDVKYLEEGAEQRYISEMDIEDLEPWQKLASVFNLKKHKFCKTVYNGEENIIEYVDVWRRKVDENGYLTKVIQYELIKMPIDMYLGNTSISTRINEDYIVEDNLQLNNYNV